MQKLTALSIAMDTSQAEKADKLISKLLSRIRQYNDQVEKSNKLLREQEQLRNKLGISVVKGKVTGLTEVSKKDK